jgi:hypothetical protein
MTVAQAPARHTWVLAQTAPQPPQLALSVAVSAQYWVLVPALHSDCPLRQNDAHVPD